MKGPQHANTNFKLSNIQAWPTDSGSRFAAHLDVNVVSQDDRAEDKHSGPPLVLLPNPQRTLKCGAPLIHVLGKKHLKSIIGMKYTVAERRKFLTLLCESIRALICPSRISCISSSSKAGTVVLNDSDIFRMSADM
jgi:hypothetical protein